MKTYTYPTFYKLLYKFGNIPLTIALFLFIVPVIAELGSKPILLLPAVISLFMIYFLNKGYLYFYKTLAYKITVEGNKVIFSDFLFSQKRIEFEFSEITSLKGGIFEGRIYGIMTLTTENNFTVGFFHTIKDSIYLERSILTKIKPELHSKIVQTINSQHDFSKRDSLK